MHRMPYLLLILFLGCLARFAIGLLGSAERPDYPPTAVPDPLPMSETVGLIEQERKMEIAVSSSAVPTADSSGAADDVELPLSQREAYAKRTYDLYREYGSDRLYRALIDAVRVTPLGLSAQEYEEYLRRDPGRVLAEFPTNITRYTSAINRVVALPIEVNSLTFLAFRQKKRFEIIIGKRLGGIPMSPTDFAAWVASTCGRQIGDLSDADRIALVRIVDELFLGYNRLRYALFSGISSFVREEGAADSLLGTDCVAVMVHNGRAHIWHKGDDPELDRLLGEFEQLDANLRVEIEGVLK